MGKIPSLTDCAPGFEPARYAVLIAPEEKEERTKGGIILADETKEREGLASLKGRLVNIAPLAFTYQDVPGSERRSGYKDHPMPGDAVLFKKYAGILVMGEDGREYRLCQDEDVIGVLDEG